MKDCLQLMTEFHVAVGKVHWNARVAPVREVWPPHQLAEAAPELVLDRTEQHDLLVRGLVELVLRGVVSLRFREGAAAIGNSIVIEVLRQATPSGHENGVRRGDVDTCAGTGAGASQSAAVM